MYCLFLEPLIQVHGYPEDPYKEWLSHCFMGRVIKDNVFGVDQWIRLLGSAHITLIEAQGSVFEAEGSGIVVEPECFFVGRKGEMDALIGPYPSPYQSDRLHRHYTLTDIERRIIRSQKSLDTVLSHTHAVRRLSGCDLSTADMSSANQDDHRVCTSVIVTHSLHAANDEGRLLSQLSSLLDRDGAESTIVLVEPVPFNDTYTSSVKLLAYSTSSGFITVPCLEKRSCTFGSLVPPNSRHT